MPYKSKAQLRWMHAVRPDLAKKWDAHTPDMKHLPEKVKDKEKKGGR